MEANQVKNLLSEYNFEGKGDFLKDCLMELNSWNCYDFEDLYNELIFDKCDNIEDMLEKFDDNVNAAKAVYFGKVRRWNDDYFYFDGYGNIASQSEYDYYKDFEEYGYDIVMGILEHYNIDIDNIKDINDLIEHIENEIL